MKTRDHILTLDDLLRPLLPLILTLWIFWAVDDDSRPWWTRLLTMIIVATAVSVVLGVGSLALKRWRAGRSHGASDTGD